MNERQPRYDAVLIHNLANKVSGPTPDRLTQRSRLAVRTAVELNPKTYIAFGPEFLRTRPTALNIKDELMRKYDVPEERIIIGTDGKSTTSQEIAFFRDQIKAHPQWHNLAHVSLDAHFLSMVALRRHLWGLGVKSKFITGEKILPNIPDKKDAKRYLEYLSALHRTKSEFYWRLYEVLKFPFLLTFVGERFSNWFALHWRSQVTKS